MLVPLSPGEVEPSGAAGWIGRADAQVSSVLKESAEKPNTC